MFVCENKSTLDNDMNYHISDGLYIMIFNCMDTFSTIFEKAFELLTLPFSAKRDHAIRYKWILMRGDS